jgi:hypothetical protein
MDDRVAKLPKWAQDMISHRDRVITRLAEKLNAKADLGNAMGVSQYDVIRFQLRGGSYVEVHGSQPLVLKPASSNHITIGVD